MNVIAKFSAVALAAAALAPATVADGRTAGSVLIYPIHRSGISAADEEGGTFFFTIVSVTNKNLTPATPFAFGGSTNVQYEYVNTVFNPEFPLKPLHCTVTDRVEFLTPADTLSVLTNCHNASLGQEGYLVITAQDPALFKTAWSFNHLMGSEIVVTSLGGVYSINAIPFSSPLEEGSATDLDGDGQLDFDDAEYEGITKNLMIDNFVALFGSSLTLINMTGGVDFNATVKFDIWNDNEFPLSQVITFRCWFEERLASISPVFSDFYLRNNTPHDPQELDINCNGIGELETGWAKISGVVATSTSEVIQDPAILGAITAGPLDGAIDGGRLLWENSNKQLNGDFLKFGTDDPEN